MSGTRGPEWRAEASLDLETGAWIIFDGACAAPAAFMQYAAEFATPRHEHLFGLRGKIVVLAPTYYRREAAVEIECWGARPGAAGGDWDYIAEAGITISTGALILMGTTLERVIAGMPDGEYRVRVSGRGYVKRASSTDRLNFLVQLWPGELGRVCVFRRWGWGGWWT